MTHETPHTGSTLGRDAGPGSLALGLAPSPLAHLKDYGSVASWKMNVVSARAIAEPSLLPSAS